MYDAIIVGARCAGSPAAMLLARKGYKVLLLDRDTFPSDTISTHIIWPTGLVYLKQWGLLNEILATNCPVHHQMTFDVGPFKLTGSPTPTSEGTHEIIAPRRYILDKILVDAAVQAGVELREGCVVEEVLMTDGKVIGVRCQQKGGSSVIEKAKIVIGADGKHSIVAKAVQAEEYNTKPKLSFWYYTYWSNTGIHDLILYARPNRAFGTVPTNNDMVLVGVSWPVSGFQEFRKDIESNYMKTLDLVPELSEAVRHGKQEERFKGMADLHGFFRKSFGPGWALIGDAAYHKDPVTAQGIPNAFQSAEQLAEAIDRSFSTGEPLEPLLAANQEQRDVEMMPMYEFTAEWASLAPFTPEQEFLFNALRGNQEEIDRFIGTIAGTVPIPEFFSPENMEKLMATVSMNDMQ